MFKPVLTKTVLALVVLLISGIATIGVRNYNEAIRNEGRIEGRLSADNDYKYEFDLLVNDFLKQEKKFNELKAEIIASRANVTKPLDEALAKEKERADNAERKAKSEALTARNFALDIRDSYAFISNLPKNVWTIDDEVIASTDSVNKRNTNIIGFVKQLTVRYEACESNRVKH